VFIFALWYFCVPFECLLVVVLGLVSSVLAVRLAGKNVLEMTDFFLSSGMQNLN